MLVGRLGSELRPKTLKPRGFAGRVSRFFSSLNTNHPYDPQINSKALILQTDQTAIPMRTLVNQHAPGVH